MDDIRERERKMKERTTALNKGRKPKFGDRMRNLWAGEGNPHRDAFFVRVVSRTGRLNNGKWYEMTDGNGEMWLSGPDGLIFIDAQQDAPTDAEIIALARETQSADPGRDGYILPITFARALLAKYAPAQDAERERDATAGTLREPKNGNGWSVVWWNESMRMMLPDHRHLDYFQRYKNGTMSITVKEVDAARAQRADKGDA